MKSPSDTAATGTAAMASDDLAAMKAAAAAFGAVEQNSSGKPVVAG
jgi:hypothetical protein